ncbi:hypothetical protein CRU99_07050 [Malaciobacter mytili]|uniref:AAA family ATPase n=1 Tax=Malaciobacter mytili TaxID=603050 RepID=UPI00100B1565|nr:hypothetical protein [Malaciobacter mytili]RXI43581.1 hypothetical protein CRU99_07050 [Malaciobacter mytili]
MDYITFSDNTNLQKDYTSKKESLKELFMLFVILNNLDKIAYLKYDSKYNNFEYEFTVNDKEVLEKDSSLLNSEYSIIFKNNEIIFGKIVFDKNIEDTQITNNLLQKIKTLLQKIFEIEKKVLSQNNLLNIFIINHNSKDFANNLQSNLNLLLNSEIEIIDSINSIKEKLSLKDSKNIIIYAIENDTQIQEDKNILKEYNEFIIVIGPNNHKISLTCGKLNISNYISYDDFSPELIKDIILNTKYTLVNKTKSNNKILALSGVSGGIGTTTFAMNIADIIAKEQHSKNVLYIDLSTTKAISNLFLTKNPIPEYTIIDLINTNEFNLEKNIKFGLEKIRENFYSINGIQKHIDIDLLQQDIFIEKLIDYILKANEHFNYIIIDIGTADASLLKSTIFDFANEIWIITELNIPHVSTLKTFFNLLKRAGLKEKISVIINRSNSLNQLSTADFDSIMSSSINGEKLIYEKFPNDYKVLGKCGSYCELASQIFENSVFIKKLKNLLIQKEFIKENFISKESKNFIQNLLGK